MKSDAPGSVVQLDLDFEMGAMGTTVSLSAEFSGGIWEDALGAKGLITGTFPRYCASSDTKLKTRKQAGRRHICHHLLCDVSVEVIWIRRICDVLV